MLTKQTLPFLFFGLFLGIAGADGEQWTVNGIRPGLHQSEVVEILGSPQTEEDSRDWEGDLIHTLKFQNRGVRVVLKQDSVCQVTGTSLERDGKVLASRGVLRSESLKALGEPLSSSPELNTGTRFSRGKDVYLGEPTSVNVNYWEGQVEDIHFCERCGVSSSASPLEKRWKLAKLAFEAAENRQDFATARERLREMVAAAREAGPDSKMMGDSLMRIYWSLAFENAPAGERPPEAGATNIQLLTHAVEIFEKSAAPLNEDLVNALDVLAKAHREAGDLTGCEACFRKAIELERAREPESWVMGRLLGDYVDVLRALHDSRAETIARDAAPIWKKHEMSDRPSHAIIQIPMYTDNLPGQQRNLFILPYSQFRSQPQLGLLRSTSLYGNVYDVYIRNARPASDQQVVLGSLRRETAIMLKESKLDPKLAQRIVDPKWAFRQLLASKIDPVLCNQALIRGLMAIQGGRLLTRHQLTRQEENTLAAARVLDRQDFSILGGIGIFLKERAGQFFVSEPLPGSPAKTAGLQAGDAILSVDHRKLSGLSMNEVHSLITGQVGSTVELEILRADEPSPRTLAIVRDQLRSGSVTSRQIEKTGYIRMRSPADVSPQLAQLRGGGITGLILDVRQAHGGLNEEIIALTGSPPETGLELLSDIVSPLVARGTVVASIAAEQTATKKEPQFGTIPMVVLIDQGTADVPEILASVLKQRPNTILLGEKSSGRSVLQQELVVPGFPDLTLRIGAREISDANGHVLTGHGVLPGETLPMDPVWIGHESKDTQLARAFAILKRQASRDVLGP